MASVEEAPAPPIPVRRAVRVVAALSGLPALAAAGGCLLPWEHFDVDAAALHTSQPYGSLHGPGLLTCAGAVIALATLGYRLLLPRRMALREAGSALAATLLIAGAALFVTPLGQPLGASQPLGSGTSVQYTVRLGVGLPLAGGAGVVLLVLTVLEAAWRRGGSRSPASSA